MNFIMVTCLAMLASVYLTYKIADYLDFNLQLKPLFFCAIFALLINFTLPILSIYFAKYHLALLIGMILSAAFLIAHYNDFLNAALSPAPEAKPLPLLPMPKSGKVTTTFLFKEPLLLPSKEMHVFQQTPIIGDIDLDAAIKKKSLLPTQSNPPAIIRASIREIVKSDMENAKLLKLTAVIAKLPSLDSILEYAYDQKRQNAYNNAIFAFKQALERYKSDDYAPFIVIEIGNIYKNSGLYDEAIVIYNRAYTLPAVMDNEDLILEFQNNISYLRITKEVLLNHACPKLAFNQIPLATMQEIEDEFACWRNQKYAS